MIIPSRYIFRIRTSIIIKNNYRLDKFLSRGILFKHIIYYFILSLFFSLYYIIIVWIL